MRRLAVSLVLFLVTISAATGVHASTACEKWVQEYRDSLKHSPAVHRAHVAHHRLHHYIHRKLVHLKKKPAAPKKPRLLPAHHSKPKMTREELLKKLELACGDLPEDRPQLAELLKGDPKPDFLPEAHDEEPVDLASNDDDLIPLFAPPAYSTAELTPPGGGAPGIPFTPGLGVGGKPPNTPVASTTTTSSQPPTDVVPEPGTLVLLLTGIPAAAEAVRRRRRHLA
jgi:hypothetical protein